ncbi:sperm axonemal maintenance protein CFAP97D1 [Ambystoma mexicanum]|uniref:sperm axonemal maintenance protein CFAP97D1 n=1 Tax=Ambystoma mexicanum TaxID=8296 RepID=UPI0037E8BFA8
MSQPTLPWQPLPAMLHCSPGSVTSSTVIRRERMNSVEYLAYPLIVGNQRQNTVLKKKWDNHHYQCHRSRVDSAKSEIDNKPPKVFLHHHVQMKKLQMEQERMAVIEKNNRLLLDRIAHIMRSKGSVDNWNECYIKSLNGGKRNRDMVKISMENQAINKRLQEGKAYYNHKKWEEEWQGKKPGKIPSISSSRYKEFKHKKGSKAHLINSNIEGLVNEVMRDLFSTIDGNAMRQDGGQIIWDEIPLCQCASKLHAGYESALGANQSDAMIFPPVMPLLRGPSSQVIMASAGNRAKNKSQHIYSQ